ncbi:unnamed protein product [Gadus morhua 'NCC']
MELQFVNGCHCAIVGAAERPRLSRQSQLPWLWQQLGQLRINSKGSGEHRVPDARPSVRRGCVTGGDH